MRAHNFCAGPAALPVAVLERAQSELLDWQGAGASVMELSHRSSEFVGIAERAEASLRRLMQISDDYAVLFQQGGASQQFDSCSCFIVINYCNQLCRSDKWCTGDVNQQPRRLAKKYELSRGRVIDATIDSPRLDACWKSNETTRYLP